MFHSSLGEDIVVQGQCLKVLPSGFKPQQETFSYHFRRVHAEAEGPCAFGRHGDIIRHTLTRGSLGETFNECGLFIATIEFTFPNQEDQPPEQ